MHIPPLVPGQDFVNKAKTDRGEEEVFYAYRSRSGKFFSCTAATEDEAREKCVKWLIRHERH